MLRAAVVLLHATMEDLLRSVSRWKLPTAPATAFEDMPFPSDKTAKRAPTKRSLDELAQYRGRSIDTLFGEAIEQFLSRSTYNNQDDVQAALKQVGIAPGPILSQFGAEIDSITKRRHLIVHQVDMALYAGSGRHLARSLGASAVEQWIKDIEAFGTAVLSAC